MTATISTKDEKKELTFKYANKDQVPYVSTYYIKATVRTGEDVKIKFYVTDYYQKEHRENDNTRTFKVIIKATGKEAITKTVKAGNTEISLGSFATEGNVDFSIIVTAQNVTKMENLKRAKLAIENVGGKIAGVVLNKVQVNAKSYESSYYYGNKNSSSKK